MKDTVKVTQQEIDSLLALIQEGKSLREIGEIIIPRRKRRPNVPKDPNAPIIKKVPARTAKVQVECVVNDKKIVIGASEAVAEGVELSDAHADLYLRLLLSLENLVTLSK